MNRPTATATTIWGICLVACAIAGGAVYALARNPTEAMLGAFFAGGVALIGVLEKAPIPSPEPVPVQPQVPVVVPVPAEPATKEQP